MSERIGNSLVQEKAAREHEAVGLSMRIGNVLDVDSMAELGEHRAKLHRFTLPTGVLEFDGGNRTIRYDGDGFSLWMKKIHKVSPYIAKKDFGSVTFFSAHGNRDNVRIDREGNVELNAHSTEDAQVIFDQLPKVGEDGDWKSVVLDTEDARTEFRYGPNGQIRFSLQVKSKITVEEQERLPFITKEKEKKVEKAEEEDEQVAV